MAKTPDPRFGYFPSPIAMKDKCIDGEMMTDPETGHIFIKNGTDALSKTLENENRLNRKDYEEPFTSNLHLMLGNGHNWINWLNSSSVGISYDTNLKRNYLTMPVKSYCSLKPTIKLPFNKENVYSIYFNGTVTSSQREFNYYLQCLYYNEDGSFAGSVSFASKKITLSKDEIKIETQLDLKNTTVPEKTAYLFISLGINNTSDTTATIMGNKFEMFVVPSFIQEGTGLKGVYDDTDASSDDLTGSKVINQNDTTTGTALEATSSTTINVIVASLITKKLKFNDYSLALRMKCNNNTLTSQALKIAVSKNTGTESNPVWTPIKDKNYPLTIFEVRNQYLMIYYSFEYTGTKAVGDMLKIEIQTIKNPTIFKVSLDYLTVMPSVVGSFSI